MSRKLRRRAAKEAAKRAPGLGAPGLGAPGLGAPGLGAPGLGAPDLGAMTPQQAFAAAAGHYNSGRLQQAEDILQQIRRRLPDSPDVLHLLAVIALQTNRPGEAAGHLDKAVVVAPGSAEIHITLGLALERTGKLDAAVKVLEKAVSLNPALTDAHYNLGVVLQAMGELDQAADAYGRAIEADPGYAIAHNNLGNTLKGMGRIDEALAALRRAIEIEPETAEFHNNLGNALQVANRLDEATEALKRAVHINPGLAMFHNNLGNVLKKLGKLHEAEASYRKAVVLKPDYAEAHSNLGNVLQDLEKQDEAVASYHKALALKPDFPEAWNGLMIAAKVLRFSQARGNRKGASYKNGLSPAARATADFAMLEYYLESFNPRQADESLRKAMAALPPKIDGEVAVKGENHKSPSLSELPNQVVALLHFGRSGTGLLHSLIDGHPEISTLPSIYLRGFFNAGVWKGISAGGWRQLPERFADEFAVLFDANSPKPTPGRLREKSVFLGREEGMANVGERRDESLSLDRETFCSEALRLMEGLERIDPKSFLLIIHAAFEAVVGTKETKQTAFYHIHNPDDFARLNFLRYVPDARLVMMVREPVQCCESWVRNTFEKNNYNDIISKIITMLFTIDQVAFRKQDSVGVRLEDLKNRPEETLRALCAWLGVKDAPSLYQMTAQGKKWWGDPSSPDYAADKAMSPFGASSTRRAVGAIFSEKDQLVLGTLFYPFSVRFAYRQPDPAGFEKALKEIRPLFDDMLDFEKVMAERSKIDPAQFKRRGAYNLLRAAFMDRWDVLNELKDYPHMLTPLL